MAEHAAKSRKMAEPHAQVRDLRARAVPGLRRRTGMRGDTVGARRMATLWGQDAW
jgi:hypothetical protein